MINKYLGYLIINSEVNRFFYMSMVGLQVIQLFLMVNGYKGLDVVKDVFLLTFIGTIPLTAFLLTIQLALVILLISNFIMFRRQQRKRSNTKNDIFILLTKTISYLVTMFKTILILPLNHIVLATFNQISSSGVQIALSSVVYVVYFIIILPITLLTYWNKFCIRKESITHPHVVNLVSIMHVYFHIFMFGYVLQSAVLPYINIVFFLLILVAIYWNSPFQYKHSNIVTFLYSLICSMFLVSVANSIINDEIQSFGGCFVFILSSFCIAYLLYHFQQVTVKQLLLNQIPAQQPTKWYHFHRNRHHNQIFLYSLLNYSENVNNVLIFFFEHQSVCTETDCLSKPIFDKLKQGESKLSLFPQIKEFFLKEVLKQYNPAEFQSLGEKEIEKVIHEKGRLSSLIMQLMLIRDEDCVMKENVRKAYYFLKQHEHLIMKSPTDYTFMSKVEIHAMIEILEEELIQTVKEVKESEKYDLKAQEYFEYQERLEQFKKEISHVCDLNISFWSEISHEDPDCKKIKHLISKSHQHSKKVEGMFNRLLNSYQRVSIVVYDTLVQFSQLVLNCELSSVFNPFFSLNSKYSQELALWKKEKLDHIGIQFTETYDIPVCMVSADKTDRGNILWENATFRQEYAFMNDIKESTESKTINIDQLVLPFYREQHDSLIDDFSKQEVLKYDHGKTIIYKKDEDRHVIEMQDIEVQVVPSLKFGLKLLVFIKKNQENKVENSDMFMILDEKLESSLLSESLINEWSLNNKNNEEIHTVIENVLFKNTEWSNLLSDSQNNNKLKFDMDQSDYEGNLLKIVKTDKGTRFFHFEIKNVFIEESPYQKALKSNPHAASCLQVFMQNTAKSLDSARFQSPEGNDFFTTIQSGKKNNPLSIPFTMTKLTQQKTQQQVLLQKTYQTMSQPTTPRKIITWRIITVILIVLIMGTMIANMIITSQRQTIYEGDIKMIKDYNLLIQYIARSMITLREYNFWAFTNVTSPRMSNLQGQLKLYKSMISSLLQSVSGMLSGVWTAYDFRESGRLINVKETQFVVVANYLLSSITYLADQPFQSMNFPFLDNEFFWYFGMTKSQSNYMNAIYNGLYVALANMLETRLTLTSKVEDQIMSIPQQLYIFPTIVGIILLIAFIIFSLIIEIKSNKIIADTSKILQSITYRDKRVKIEQIKRFKQMFLSNQFDASHSINLTQQKDHSQYETNSQLIKQDTIMSESDHNMNIMSPANTTDRQLKFNKMDNDLDSHKIKPKSHFGKVKFEQKQQKQGNNNNSNSNNNNNKSPNNFIIPPDRKQHQTVKISVESNNKLTFLFYVCVVMPFLAYFIAMFVGGYHMNNKIMQYVYYGSEMYHLSTFQEYIYLYTRETFLFQNPPEPGFSWGAVVVPGLLKIYDSSRYVESQFFSIDQSSKFAQTKTSIEAANLCNFLYLFQQQSIYYNVTFDKTECEQIGNHIMTKGYKSSFVYFVETSVELLTRNMNPQTLKRDERVTYLTGPELRNMKVLLAYFEQFYKALNKQFQQNIDEMISYYIKLVNIASIILIFSLLLIIKAVNYRWQVMKSESIQVQSILRLISFNLIKQDRCLREKFQGIDCQFYQ